MSRLPTDPSISVVIATHNRAGLLSELLAALAEQTVEFETVVVDDASTDETPQLLATRDVQHLRVSHGGPAHARQAGWQHARGQVIAFTDDDCLPTPGWLAALTAPIEAGRADIVQGKTLPRTDQLDRVGPWSRTQHVEEENGYYQTCNIAYRRSVLEDVGGFAPEFYTPRTSGEDVDLAWRAKEKGFRSTFAQDAVVYHVVWPSSYRKFLADRFRWSHQVQVVRRHPELRRFAYRRWFYRRSHVRTLVVLVTAGTLAWFDVRAPFALGAVVASAYLVKTRRRPEPPLRRLLLLAQVGLADLVEFAMFVGASARYRTVLL